ncbi:serine/threonine protein kinase [Lujinxingia vulgaris]|uniref:Serine/threonine protein kinase n=1 Tax=Lujinxingia vulgaris TaxID=2600176 RepID=A0A5C6XB30_9DELT|nr:serine/threonine protein kinase [Lujinxingia vulgaris]
MLPGPPADLRTSTVRSLGPYRLIERIGVGGMAEVYLAHAMRYGDLVQPCVVKVLHRNLAADRSFTRMLLEEAKLIAVLRHNNISSLYDVGSEDGNFFLVMEYVNGRDLHAVLAEGARQSYAIPVATAVQIARDVCNGLQFAHTRTGSDGRPLQLVHRDISPQNILLSVLGEVKLIDFGIAKFDSKMRERTRAGVIKGKFGYMSPEQAWDEPLDHRSDLFSVGICLYEMLTGRSVYGQSEDPLTMLKRARQAEIVPIQQARPGLPESLIAVVERALARKREDRYQSAYDFSQALSQVLAEIAPGHTGLESGALLKELFEQEDPALDSLARAAASADARPRGRDPRSRTARKAPTPVPAPIAVGEIEESTAPMQEVPEEVRLSGAYAQVRPDDDFAHPDDATRVKTVPADFANEKTELFDEVRFSGAHDAVAREAISRSGPLPTFEDDWGDDEADLEPETNPHHRSPELPDRSHERARSPASPSNPRADLQRSGAQPSLPRRENTSEMAVSPAQVGPSGLRAAEVDRAGGAKMDRRTQIIVGVVLVLAALGFIATRFL